MNAAVVAVDASYCYRTGCAGWAAIIEMPWFPDKVRMSGSFSAPVSGSQDAEIRAAINAIFVASRRGAEKVVVQTDCMAVVHAVQPFGSVWPRRWQTLMRIAWRQTGMSAPVPAITATHVRAHTGALCPISMANDWCDQQARKAMRESRDGCRERRLTLF